MPEMTNYVGVTMVAMHAGTWSSLIPFWTA